MKIVTVNLPESYIKAMKKLVGPEGLYPSRSELIRCATRAFLEKEISLSKMFDKTMVQKEKAEETNHGSEHVIVPDEDGGSITYKIVRRLEIN